MAHKMFRYLEKYVGKYRVRARYDEETEDFPREENGSLEEEYDEQYIDCARGEIRATYRPTRGKDILCWYTESGTQGRNVYKEIKETYPDIWIENEDLGQYDYFIYFDAEDIEKIASIVKPKTSGASIRPYSVKNLPKVPYDIPEADLKKLGDIVDSMEKVEKMLFVRDCCKAFIIKANEIKGKNFDFKTEQKKSKLSNREFIHSIGLWDEYVEFVKENKKVYDENKIQP